MSNLLKKALKFALAPAILIIATKVIGVFVLSSIYGFDIQLGNDIGQIFSTQIYISSEKDAIFLNSLSDSITIISLLLPLTYMIIKTLLSQTAQRNPKTVIKLTKINLLKWVTKEDTSFLKIFIWTTFFWIISGLTITNAIQGKTYSKIGITAGVLVLITAWAILHIFEMESNKVYPE